MPQVSKQGRTRKAKGNTKGSTQKGEAEGESVKKEEALIAARLLQEYCDDTGCQKCIFNLYPKAAYGYERCWFSISIIPSCWESFLDKAFQSEARE